MPNLDNELWQVWIPRELDEESKRVMKKYGYGENKSDFLRYCLREGIKKLNDGY